MSGMTRRDVSTAQLMKTHGYSARTDYHKDKQDAQAVRELAREILRPYAQHAAYPHALS